MHPKELVKIQVIKEETVVEGDVDDDFLERFADETGWRSVLLYQYLSGYIVFIAISAIICTVIAWLEMMHVMIVEKIPQDENTTGLIAIIYAADIVYWVDIMFRILYMLVQWPNKKIYNEMVPVEFIILDILSAIPYDVLYSSVKYNPRVSCILRLRVLIRMYRIPTALSQLRKMFHQSSMFATSFWTIAVLLMGIVFPSSIHYIYYCRFGARIPCTYRNFSSYLRSYAVASSIILTNGADFKGVPMLTMYHIYGFMTIVYYVAFMFVVGELTCKSLDRMKPMYTFIHDYEKSMQLYQSMKEWYHNKWTYQDEQIQSTLKDYYSDYLSQRSGIASARVLHKVLPPGITKFIIMDMALDAFTHSHIFRNLELNIVRFLSTLVSFEFAVPGEVIVKNGTMMDKMIYISHGVLQILSHQDGETPVLHLSGGTSLGETGLFVSYPMNCTIICQSYCELIVIEKTELKKMMQFYPMEFRDLVKIIMTRFHDAKIIRKIAQKKIDKQVVKSDLLIMSWIKEFQRCFYHEQENDITSVDSKLLGLQLYIDELIFYVPYLDKLVVSDEIELIKDSVFLKASFHFILQPRSPILIVWNVLVLLLTVLFVVIYPLNLCYPKNNRGIQTVYTMFVTIIFWIDIYLQMFTAIKIRGTTYLTFKAILIHRLQQRRFLLDCIAAFPIEYFTILLTGDMPDAYFLMLHSNRLLKYYKIFSFVNDLNVFSTKLLTVFNYLKYIIHFVFYYHYATMITYILNCFEDACSPRFNDMFITLGVTDNVGKLLATVPLSNSLVTGVVIGEMPKPDRTYIYVGYTIVSIIGFMLKTLFLVHVISSSALEHLALLREQEQLMGIAHALSWFEVSRFQTKSICNYLNTLFYFNCEMYTHFNDMKLPKELGVSFRNIHLSRILSENAFFGGIPKNELSTLTDHVKLVIIPSELVVFYSGQSIDECYVIHHGYCKMWYGGLNRVVTINENLGLVEVLLNIPIYHTIVTTSDCILMKFSKNILHRFLRQFPTQATLVYNALTEFETYKDLLTYTEHELNANPMGYFNDIVMQMHHKRKRTELMLINEMRKHKRRRYRIRVIRAGSRNLFYWEIAKNIAWSLSVDLTGYIIIFGGAWCKVVLFMLDLISIIDVFIRMFVSYYDKKGIEVTKATKTIAHYLSHAFIIDALSVLPFDIFVSNTNVIFARCNRYLQSYRVLGFAYHCTTRIKKVHQFFYIAHLLIFYAVTENLSTYYITTLCTVQGNAINCTDTSWLVLSFGRDLKPFQVYTETHLFLLSIFFGIGFTRFVINNFWERIVLTIWGISGQVLSVIIIGRAVSYYMFRNADLTTYQEAMKDLVRFLSYCDIDKHIKYEVIQHFEYVWEKREGKDIADIICNFPPSVKKDLLFNIYGKYLRKNSSVFGYAEDNFLKSLLMIGKQETFRKTGIIYRVNDIIGTIYFLLKGSVDVVGPDGNVLVTLSNGSLFGCLDDCVQCRQTLTMVANVHVETLAFTSENFYALLYQHPNFHLRYVALSNMQFDFMPSVPISHLKRKMNKRSSIGKILSVQKIVVFKIIKPSKYLWHLEIGLYVFEFVFGTLYELVLQVVMGNVSLWMCAYARDVLWLVRIYFKFHVAYEDASGMLEFNRKKVAMRYIQRKDGFYFDLFCVFPLDCFTFLIPSVIPLQRKWFLLCRLNRFGRCYYLFRHMSRTTKKLNINVLMVRTSYILMFAFYYMIVKFIVYYFNDTRWELLPVSNLIRLSNAMLYMDTILFVFTQTTVPFRDISVNRSDVILVTIITMDVCCLVYLFSNFAATLQISTKVKTKYLNVCHNLKVLMGICAASTPMIEKIDMYTNILLRRRNGIQFPFLLEHAPLYLREAVLNSMFGFHLRHHYLFKDCHVDFLRQLAATMRTLTYFQGNHVCDLGDIDETMYFIQEGVIQALTKDTLYAEVCEFLLVAGESFGLDQIIHPRCGQTYTYRASMLTTLVTIKRNDFIRLLAFFPSAKKHIYDIVTPLV